MESRRASYEGVCETCKKRVFRGEVVLIDKRTGTDGWILWHLDCDAQNKRPEAPRKAVHHKPRVWIDTRRFRLPWDQLGASL